MTNDAGDDGNSLNDTSKRFGVIGSTSKTQVLGSTLQNDAIKRALSFSDSLSPLGKAIKRSQGIGLAFYQEQLARTVNTGPMLGQLQEAMFQQDQILRQFTGLGRRERLPWDSDIKALRTFQSSIGPLIKQMDQTRELAKSWDRDFNFGLSKIGESIRAFNAHRESINRFIGQLGEPFELATRLSQSDQFKAWQAAAVGHGMQALVDRALADLESNELASVRYADFESEEDLGAPERAVLLVAWVTWLTTAVRHTLSDPKERKELLQFMFGILMFLYSDISGRRDQDELRSEIHQLKATVTTEQEEHKADVARLEALLTAQIALQVVSQSFEVLPLRAPLRSSPAGQLAGELRRGDEVQVWQASGKWRFVRTVNDEGQVIEGWVMKKHLRHVND
ncbi:hypothetical protein IB69_004790 [Xanthomonas citri]|uniref:hypothetical protein n=1 Tax=Xanthomonas citri TaxID=346 RepID=UPI0006E616A0|nr:hypothetical protein [Xanthomonas citri]MBO9752916.1 hypothetical protein [Xanthomonas phaseoli pv. dieffenbachiae]OQP79931.1 hypothetical protein IB69_004790 [Xanthomonas citri]